MRPITILTLIPLMIAIAVAGNSPALATVAPTYYEGAGGTISGIVVSPYGNVVDWSQIYANNGNQTFEAFSGFSGFYLMRVPAGTYNVSVYDFYNSQYWAPNANVTVADGSTTTVNFYLQPQPPSPVPEFQPDLLVIVTLLAITAASIMTRRSRKRSVSH